MRFMRAAWLIIGVAVALVPFNAQSNEFEPGDSCKNLGDFSVSERASINGGHLLVCDGTIWKSIYTFNASGLIVPSLGHYYSTCDAGSVGRLQYNSSTGWMEYCSGTEWVYVQGATSYTDCSDDASVQCLLGTTRSDYDPEFLSANIRNGTNVLGVTGTFVTNIPDCVNDDTTYCTLHVDRDDYDGQLHPNYIRNGVGILNVTGIVTEPKWERAYRKNNSPRTSNEAPGATSDDYGAAVDIDGDTIIVGDPYAEAGPSELNSGGQAYIWQRSSNGNWYETASFYMDTPVAYRYYGWDVAVDGDLAVVGSYRENEGAAFSVGAVYVYEQDSAGNWSQDERITIPAAPNYIYLGRAVDISDTTIAAGAYGEVNNNGGTYGYSGAVYIYDRDISGNWVQTDKIQLPAANAQNSQYFGFSLALDGDNLVVGAYRDSSPGFNINGAVYVYTRDETGTWTGPERFDSPNLEDYSNFGYAEAVDIDDDILVVGAYAEDIGADASAGRAYIFERDETGTWSAALTLQSPSPTANGYFGRSVSVKGNLIAIGAPGEVYGQEDGSVYMYEKDRDGNWYGPILTDLDSGDGWQEEFGESVAVYGKTLAGGAPDDVHSGWTYQGAVYMIYKD